MFLQLCLDHLTLPGISDGITSSAGQGREGKRKREEVGGRKGEREKERGGGGRERERGGGGKEGVRGREG